MLVRHNTRLVADGEEDILKAALAEELVSRTEGNLDDTAEFCQLFSCVALNVCNALI